MIGLEFPSVAWAYHLGFLLTVVALFFIVAAVMVIVARPMVRSIVEVMTSPPGEDVLGEVEEFERGRVFR